MLDTASVARAIEHSILVQRHLHAHVSCPARIEKKKGLDFVCIARGKFPTTKFAVLQKNDRGGVTYIAAK
jgi:hypothetical protein